MTKLKSNNNLLRRSKKRGFIGVLHLFLCCFAFEQVQAEAAPVYVDAQFELPSGFHIYKLAENDVTGGSYDIVFDGQGRILVGDTTSVRRLEDKDKDGLYESYKVIATGLGGRGPQGLLVYGDNLYAVGGDGVQLYSGYESGDALKHQGRLGARFNTGGDHAAHTLLRGLDGYVYLVTGDGGGVKDRTHITEETSPVLFERAASVFRFDQSGTRWECVSTGSRNPPNLGMNYLGEFFSMDSDMEWHVDLPFYRPVRLNHWIIGGDNGWHGVGALKPYQIDNVSGVVEVGRGSPNWGQFYEHNQFPERYRDTFFVCDYRWKSATSGGYNSTGRLVAFHLKLDGANWTGEMEEFAKGKPGGVDGNGTPINFGLVDLEIAPDGSLVFSDHNQGIWRVFYDPTNDYKKNGPPSLKPKRIVWPSDQAAFLKTLLSLPQPMSEWTRLQEVRGFELAKFDLAQELKEYVLSEKNPLRHRLRAFRLLASSFGELPTGFVKKLAGCAEPKLRGQAAWLIGIRGQKAEQSFLVDLLSDPDPFVRRRSAEAMSRNSSQEASLELVNRLNDPVRLVRYTAMTALAHRATEDWIDKALGSNNPQTVMRALIPAEYRREKNKPEWVRVAFEKLLRADLTSSEDELDFLRVVQLNSTILGKEDPLLSKIGSRVLSAFPAKDRSVRWEQAVVLGQLGVNEAFSAMLAELLGESNYVTQFHLADCIADLAGGWTEAEQGELANWILSTQSGWFAEFDGKGRQFPGFWQTVVRDLVERHGEALISRLDKINMNSSLHRLFFDWFGKRTGSSDLLLKIYHNEKSLGAKLSLLNLVPKMDQGKMASFLENELSQAPAQELRLALLTRLARTGKPTKRRSLFLQALLDGGDNTMIQSCAQRVFSAGQELGPYLAALTGEHSGIPAKVYKRLLGHMSREPSLTQDLEAVLQVLSGQSREVYKAEPNWIWPSKREVAEVEFFRKIIQIPEGAGLIASVEGTCDNEFTLFVNGERIGHSNTWEKPVRFSLNGKLKQGANHLAVEAANHGGPAGLLLRFECLTSDGKLHFAVTDQSWRSSSKLFEGWKTATKLPPNWKAPLVLGSQLTGSWRGNANILKDTKVDMSRAERTGVMQHWAAWYKAEFGQALVLQQAGAVQFRDDAALHTILMQTKGGDAKFGMKVYEKVGCHACHGKLPGKKGRIFGPDLTGVTLRMTREELVDALIYPSKFVPERFKALLFETKSGEAFTGFMTQKTADSVTFTYNEDTRRLPINEIHRIRPQPMSLMPPKLLSTLSDKELTDLVAYLRSLN